MKKLLTTAKTVCVSCVYGSFRSKYYKAVEHKLVLATAAAICFDKHAGLPDVGFLLLAIWIAADVHPESA